MSAAPRVRPCLRRAVRGRNIAVKVVLALTTFLFVTTYTSLAACGPKAVIVDGEPMSFEQGASYLYRLGHDARSAGKLADARRRWRELVDNFDGAPEVPDALAELVQLSFDEGGCPRAEFDMARMLERYGAHPRAARVKKLDERCRADADARKQSPLGQAEAAYASASSGAERAQAARVAGQAAAAASEHGAAAQWLLKALRELGDRAGPEAKKVEAEIVEAIDTRLSFQEVRELLEATDGDAFPREVLEYKLGRIQYHVRDHRAARETLTRFVGKWPRSPYADGAKRLLADLDARANVNVKTIGVLAPVTGKLRSYGESVLEAVRLASGELTERGGGELNIVVRDTKGDPVEAAKAVHDLVHVDGAIAIVGALFRVEAEGAAEKAQELGVPLVALTADEGVTEIGPYVLRLGLTNSAQMEALVAHAVDVLGMKRFAILYPRHPYGEEMLHLFWDRVDARRGEIRSVQSYGAEDTTFTEVIRQLVGRDSPEARADLAQALRECRDLSGVKRSRCEKEAQNQVKPIIDFDALFIPDYPRTLALVAPALAAEDIIVEREPRYLRRIEKTLGRKITPITLLGASGWNSPALPEKAGRYVENALFPDAFFPGEDTRDVQGFVDTFKAQFGKSPALPEALFYDAIRVIRQVVRAKSPATREDMRAALREVHDFPGVTGKVSFRTSNDVARQVHILTIKDGQITPASLPLERPARAEGEGEQGPR